MTSRVVVVGDALIDELRDEAGVREFVGGAALNVAVGVSRLGVPASLIAMVGDDSAGEHNNGSRWTASVPTEGGSNETE